MIEAAQIMPFVRAAYGRWGGHQIVCWMGSGHAERVEMFSGGSSGLDLLISSGYQAVKRINELIR